MPKVTAIVVTYNRKELLCECLRAIRDQTVPLNEILVINNCSTDGTETLFSPEGEFSGSPFQLITTASNLGGAGGFHRGIVEADQSDCDWVWIMDDDTIPSQTALEELLSAYDYLNGTGIEKVGFLASTVYGPNGESMNVPVIQRKVAENGYPDWYRHLGAGLVRIESATFVSILVSHDAIKAIGYPCADYFIWGDDTEYTQRLDSRYGPSYFCGKSKVLHKRFNAKNISIQNEENKARVSMYRYFFRNSLLNARKYNKRGNAFLHILQYEYFALRCLFGKNVMYRARKFWTIQKGIFAYVTAPKEKKRVSLPKS